MMNRVVIVGRMTRDPELNRTGSGNSVCHFTLAIDRNIKTGDGQQADFIPVVVWNKQAENVAQYCGKGSLIGVDGSLRSRSYDNKQGQHVYVVEVRADSVQFLETRAARERQAGAQSRVSNDNFYNGNSYGNNQQANSYQSQNNNYSQQRNSYKNAGNNQQANSYQSQNNNYSQQSNSYNNAANANNFNQSAKPQTQSQNNNFHDMKTVNIDNGKDFDATVDNYNIMDDDIQF